MLVKLKNVIFVKRNRDSVVGIATGWLRAGGPRSRCSSLGRVKYYLFSAVFIPALRSTQHSIEEVQGTLSPEVKRRGSEADHSLPASAEVKNIYIYKSAPPYAFVA
jgi:hypothetical protein